MADETRDIAAQPTRQLAESRNLARLMAEGYRRMVDYYAREMSPAKAKARARASGGGDVARADQAPPAELSWWTLGRVTDADPERGRAIWERVLAEARDELYGGQRSVDAAAAGGGPWDRARYTALLQLFIDDLQPRSAVEAALVEAMAEARSTQLLWTERHRILATNDAERQDRGVDRRGEWPLPTVDAATAIENAARMIERSSQVFITSLRALHDLRGAAPSLTVRDVGQMNVAQVRLNLAGSESADGANAEPTPPQAEPAPQGTGPSASPAKGDKKRGGRRGGGRDTVVGSAKRLSDA